MQVGVDFNLSSVTETKEYIPERRRQPSTSSFTIFPPKVDHLKVMANIFSPAYAACEDTLKS
jgi:hypothetical protein